MTDKHWRDKAVCKGEDYALFELRRESDPEPRVRWRQALAMCAVCPVRPTCLETGIEIGGDGIWGGELLSFGQVQHRELVPPRCQTCGKDLLVGNSKNPQVFYCSRECARFRVRSA